MPDVQTGLVQPSIEALKIRPAALGSLHPDATTAILHVLLDDAFSQPAARLQNSGSNRWWPVIASKRALTVRLLP